MPVADAIHTITMDSVRMARTFLTLRHSVVAVICPPLLAGSYCCMALMVVRSNGLLTHTFLEVGESHAEGHPKY